MGESNWRVLCTRCLEESDAVRITPGSTLLDFLLLLASLPFLLIPFFLYFAWRTSATHWVCSVCHSKEIVPKGSKRARLLEAEAARAEAT